MKELTSWIDKVTVISATGTARIKEEKISLVLNDKPKWWPGRLYRYAIRKLISEHALRKGEKDE